MTLPKIIQGCVHNEIYLTFTLSEYSYVVHSDVVGPLYPRIYATSFRSKKETNIYLEDSFLLRYDTVLMGNRIPPVMGQRTVLITPLRLKKIHFRDRRILIIRLENLEIRMSNVIILQSVFLELSPCTGHA